MTPTSDVDQLIREALAAEDLEGFERLGEPSLSDAVTEIFRGRMRWYGAMFMAMILVSFAFAVFCGVKLLTTDMLPHTIRWGVGAIFGWLAVMGGKTWYWMQTERVAMTREIKRVELLVAQLSRELSSDR